MSQSRGIPYFYNSATMQSSWEPPAGMTNADVKQLPGGCQFGSSGNVDKHDNSVEQIRCNHILLKNVNSRNPKTPDGVRGGSLGNTHL